MTDTRAVFDHHVEAFGSQDLEEIMVDYDDDSVIVTNMGTFRGLDEIEGLFADLFEEFSQPGTALTVDERIVEGEFAYLVWHAETPDNVYEFCTDTFHVPDGTISFQTFAGKVESKG
ncbi:MAG: nuclear transport factor 2 family protein [Haloferacaceae archaeon]